jgi:tRNA modification GTPase
MTETIAAISTAPGRAALAVVRLSGDDAFAVAARVVPLDLARVRTLQVGIARDARGETIDEVVSVLLSAPASYTGENMVEITCHGGDWSAPRLLSALLEAGARAARPGEFTERAFVSGRLDLAQAEAVADVIHAESELAHRLAARQVSGALSRGLSQVAEPLRDLLAEIEAHVDFAEDVGVWTIPPDGFVSVLSALDSLLAGSDLGRRAREGARLAVVGRPNVGKSSLFNALLGEERALVAPVPGTTRDAVSERLDLAGIPLRLVDTAGVRTAGGQVERLGIARTYDEIEQADVVLHVLDASALPHEEDLAIAARVTAPRIAAANKSDLPRRLHDASLYVSAHTGEGLPALRDALALAAGARGDGSAALVTNARHIDALRRARVALVSARDAAETEPGEIVAG